MAITTTPNLALPSPDGNENVSNGPSDYLNIVNILDAGSTGPTAVRMQSGTLAALPAANTVPFGTLYHCTNANCAFYSDHSTWHYIPFNGSQTPVGALQQYIGTGDPADPDGTVRWVICNGRALSRTTYSGLFALVATTFGAGDGSTTFNIPDLRGRVPVGAGTGAGLSVRTLAATGGEENHALVTGEMAAHTHTITSGTTGASVNSATTGVSTQGSGTGVSIQANTTFGGLQAAIQLSGAGIFTGQGGVSGNTLPEASSGSWGGNNGNHGHGVSDPGHGHGITDPSHSHGLSDPGHSHGGATGSVGSGTAHNTMQPFLVVNHIVKVL